MIVEAAGFVKLRHGYPSGRDQLTHGEPVGQRIESTRLPICGQRTHSFATVGLMQSGEQVGY